MADLTGFGQQFKKTIVNTMIALRDNHIEEWDALNGKALDELATSAKDALREFEFSRNTPLNEARDQCHDFLGNYDEWEVLGAERRALMRMWDGVISRAEEKL